MAARKAATKRPAAKKKAAPAARRSRAGAGQAASISVEELLGYYREMLLIRRSLSVLWHSCWSSALR